MKRIFKVIEGRFNHYAKTFGTVLIMLLCVKGYATTYTSTVATGNWSISTTWSPAGVPGSNDNVVIHGGDVITVDSIFTCHNLDIGDATSATTTTLNITLATNSLNITGDLRINPNNLAKTFYLDAGPGIVNISGTFSTWGTLGTNTIKVAAGTITFVPAITIASNAQNISFYGAGTINFNSSFTDNYNNLLTYASCIVNFKGSYTVSTTDASWASRGTACFSNIDSITATSNLTLYNVLFNSSARTTLTSNADSVVIGGTVTLSSGSVFTSNSNIDVNGAWTNNGGTFNGKGTTLTFNATLTINGTSSTSFPIVQIGHSSSTAAKTVTMNNSNSCTGLIFSSATKQRTFNIAAGTLLNINGDLVINQPGAAAKNTLGVNTGTCVVTGNLIFSGTVDITTWISKVAVTTGSFTLNGTVSWMSNNAVATELISVTTGTITFGSSLTMGTGSGTLSVTGVGTINFNGLASPSFLFGGAATSPVFTSHNGCFLSFANGFTNTTTALVLAATSTSTFTGKGAITPNASITFGKMQINASDTINSGAGSVIVAGIFTLATSSLLAANQNFEVRGNWVNNGGAVATGSNSVILNGTAQTIGGTYSTSFQSLQIGASSITSTVVCTANINTTCSNLIFHSSTLSRTMKLSSGDTLTVTGDIDLNQPAAAKINSLSVNTGTCIAKGNLVFSGTNNTSTWVSQVSVTTGAFALSGNVTWMSNTAVATEIITVTTGTLTFGSSLTMGTGSGTLSITGAATVNFNGTTVPSLNFGAASNAPVFNTSANSILNFNAGITNTGSAIILADPSSAAFTGTATINPSAAITFSSIQINSGSTLSLAGNISLVGNWTNLGGTFSPGTNSVTLNAASPNIQTITKTGGETFYGLTVSNSGATVKLANDVTVTNNLVMNGPDFNLNNNNLIIGNNAGASLTRTAGNVYAGTWKRWFPVSAITSSSGSYYGLFPIGTATDYRPVTINSTVTPVTAGYVSATHTDAVSITLVTYTDNESASIQDISDMNSTLSLSGLSGGTYTIAVSFTGFANTGSTSNLKLETYNSSMMGSVGTTVTTTGTVVNPTISRSGLSSTQLGNVWIIGSKNKATTPLRPFYYTRKTGSWNDVTTGNGTWSNTAGGSGPSCDCVPSTTGYAIIDSGHTVTLTANATADYLDINTGAALTDNGTATLTVNKDLTLYGTGTFANTSSWTITHDLNLASTSTPTSTGTITVNKQLSIPFGGTYTQSGGTLNIAADASIQGTLTIGTATLNFNGTGNLTGNGYISGNGTPTINMSNNKTIISGTSLTIGSGSNNMNFAITGSTTVTNNGHVKIYGNLTGNVSGSTWTNAANSYLEVTGSMLSTGKLNSSASPDTVVYSGNSAQTIKSPVVSYYDLVIAGGNTKSLAAAIEIDDAATIKDSAVLDMTTYALTGTADLNMSGTSELKMQRSASGTYPVLSGDFNLTGGTITINQTGGTCTLQNGIYNNLKFTGSRPYDLSGVSTINGNCYIQGSATLINTISLSVGGAFNYASSGSTVLNDDLSAGSFTISSGTLDDGGNTISVNTSGGWTNNGGTFTASGEEDFNGNAAQVIGGNAATTFNDVVINNSGGVTLNVSPSAPTLIGSSLTMQSGILYTDTNNILRILDNTTCSQGSPTSYIWGPVVKVGNDDFTFPLGKNGRWRRLGISGITDSLTEVTAEYFSTPYASLTPVSGNIQQVSGQEYWTLNRAVSSDSLQLQLFWEDISQLSGWDCGNITIAHWKNGKWQEEPASPGDGSSCSYGGSGNLMSNGYVSSFSPFTFGGATGSALPIQLLSFQAQPQGNNVITAWSTAIEINNNYFTVERSANATDFEELARVEGSGNSTTEKDYSWTDENPLPGISYYRLKQTDFNGNFTYSQIVAVQLKKAVAVKLYPNPAHGQVYISFPANAVATELSIYDMQGRQALHQSLAGGLEQTISIPLQGLLPGLYCVVLKNSGEDFYKEKLMIK